MGKKEPRNTDSKIGAPAPRANHTATYVPDLNKVYIIGGHGGVGYSRKAFNDVHTYDVETHEWKKEDIVGNAPKERGGHTASLLPDSSKIFVYGGWNSSTQFENFYLYECEKKEWIDLDTPLSEPCRWSHSAVVVPALPKCKLFIFGGSSEFFEEGTARNFAKLSNHVGFIDIRESLKQSKWSIVATDKPELNPLPRENTAMVYDEDDNRLIVFGGWSKKYMGDVHQLSISKITGPSYAIYSIEPVLGPYSGGTECMVTGEGFFPNRSYCVNFTQGKHSIDANASFVSATQIKCFTPSFEGHGQPRQVEVRVFQVGGDLTLTDVNFEYYFNTTPSTTLAFGPGLLSQNLTGTETVFMIQARNKKNENRKSGNDTFKVEVYHEVEESTEDEEGEVTNTIVRKDLESRVTDLENGNYEVHYTYEGEGEVKINVTCEQHTDRSMQSIRGAPYVAHFVKDVPAENNQFNGPQMEKYIESRISEIKEFIEETNSGIDTADEEYKSDIKKLLRVKENTQRISENEE